MDDCTRRFLWTMAGAIERWPAEDAESRAALREIAALMKAHTGTLTDELCCARVEQETAVRRPAGSTRWRPAGSRL